MPVTPPPALGDVISSTERRIEEKKKKGGSSMVVLFSQKFLGGNSDANSFKEHFEELGYAFSVFRKCKQQFWDITINW